MYCRKSVARLTTSERSAFVNAVLALRANGGYARYTTIHAIVPAHGNPLFFPWHRQFILDFENDLRAIDPSVTLPYWDWTVDNLNGAGTESLIWRDDFLGGPGAGFSGPVTTGPFAGWGIQRRGFNIFTSPGGGGTIASFLGQATYTGFRGVEGPHGSAHGWVGGDMGSVPTAPRDPTFFLLHCNVDRLWAEWIHAHQGTPGFQPYEPISGAPDPRWNVTSNMWPWDGTSTPAPIPPYDTAPLLIAVSAMLDHRALGYGYDTIDPECVPIVKYPLKELKEIRKELLWEKPIFREKVALREKRPLPEKLPRKELKEPVKELKEKDKEFKEKDKDLVEGGPIERQRHFIGEELRPDLSQGPLSHEPDVGLPTDLDQGNPHHGC